MAVKLARATAQELGLQLSEIRWQRGYEVADLDTRSLVLGRGCRSVCQKIPNEWLENLVKTGREPRLEDTIREMLGHLQKVRSD